MAATEPSSTTVLKDRLEAGAGFRRAYTTSLFVGGAGMILALLIGYFADHTFRRFYFSYLISFAFFLSISIGAILFVLVQHLTRAGWSVGVRRIAEVIGCAMPILAALSAPIVISVVLQRGELYRWAQHLPAHGVEHHQDASPAEIGEAEKQGYEETSGVKPLDEITLEKRPYLNPGFFLARLLVYFGLWSAIGVWYWWRSVEQDDSHDQAITQRMQRYSAPAMLLMFATLTLGSFDLLMSLDPTWFSTIFGVYFFAGSAVAIFATLILITMIVQRAGYLTEAVTIEHYHDLGKFLFAFTFFWGYIAFSQYMLLWYANIPETTGWFARRGASSVDAHYNGWTIVSLLLLFGHLIIPFGGLLSRHVKRRKTVLAFWAGWMLVFHWIDLFWIVMPELDGKFHFGFVDVACLTGIGGIWAATILRLAMRHKLAAVADPRFGESLAFENI
jgi:hypothetical protein